MSCCRRILPFVLALSFLLVSCDREEKVFGVEVSSDKIEYSVGWEKGFSTRVEAGRELLSLVGKDSLFLYMYVGQNNANAPEVETKDAPYTNGTIPSIISYAYLNDNTPYISGDNIEISGGEGSSERFWPLSEPLNFFAYATSAAGTIGVNEAIVTPPAFNVTKDGDDYKYTGLFSYSLPEPSTEKKDAENQPDLVFAITPSVTKSTAGGKVEMEFHHALSAIYFKVGKIPAGVTVNSISLKGVKYSGECMVSYNPSGGKPKDVLFEWSNLSATGWDFCQAIGNTEDFNSDELIKTNDDQVFMIIPQSFVGTTATLEISITIGEDSYLLTKELKQLALNEWNADTEYTFVISMPEEVDVEIDDKVEGNEKSSLEITNTGLAPSYIRVALVGYWVVTRGDGTEDIVAAWDETKDGEFTALCPAGWIKCSADGYYYFTDILEPGEVASPALFEKYALTASAPVVGAQLRLSVIVQSVIANKVNSINETSGWVFN